MACFYELVREARPIIAEFERWLRFKKSRAKLFRKAKEQGIEKEDLQTAFLLVIQDEKFVAEQLAILGPAEVIPIKPHIDKARKLLSSLSDEYREVAYSDYNVGEKTEEGYGDKLGTPRLRFVAEHLIKDTPWLKIPKADRDNAIAAKARVITFGRDVPAIELVDELQELVRSNKALSGMFLEDVRIKLPEIWVRFDRSDRALREIWMQLGERLVINRRPEQWKHKAKVTATGQRKTETWCQVALEGLAAMRLRHVLPPKDARARFFELYPGAKNISDGDFPKLSKRFIKRFQRFFVTDQKPRHAETLADRLKVGNEE
jgi:hypothetical protein